MSRLDTFLWHHKNRHRWPKWIRRVAIFYQRTTRTEMLTFLLFVGIAFFFWTVQVSREETVDDFTVSFVVKEQPQDAVFTTHIPHTLKLTLADSGTRLFEYRRRNALKQLEVDFARYADAVGNFRISAAELQSLLSESLESSTRIVTVSPSLIDARFAQTEGRKFPVRVTASFIPAPNYRVHALSLSPDSIIINAPTAVLDTLRYVYALCPPQHDLRDTLRQELPLALPIGVKATPDKVHLTVPVAQYVEKTFDRVDVITKGVPEGFRLVVFPYSTRVSCLVDFTAYRTIHSQDFKVVAHYDSIASPRRHSGMIPLSVSYKKASDVVTRVTVSPAQAEFILEPIDIPQ